MRAHIERLERTAEAWSEAGDGWQGAEVELQLLGWTRARRGRFLRRPADRAPAQPALPASTAFDFVQVLDHGPCYAYVVLVTNTEWACSTLAQAYRDRADCENVFAEIKMVLCRIGTLFNRLRALAEQLSPEAIWSIILSVAFRVWLRGKALHPVVEGHQTLLLFTPQGAGCQNKNGSATRSVTELLFLSRFARSTPGDSTSLSASIPRFQP